MGTWSHQNAYRRKRLLESGMSHSVRGERLRAPNSKGRVTCFAQVLPQDPTSRCQQRPILETDYCRFHGGASPQAQRKAAIRHNYRKASERVAELVAIASSTRAADVLVQRMGGGLIVATGRTLNDVLNRATKKDPREVLLQQVHEAASMASATRELAGEIDVEALQDPDHDGHAKAQQTHDLFQTWQKAATHTAKMALDVGIDEQMVRLAEMQAKTMAAVLKRVLATDVLQMSPAQQKVALSLLGQGFRDMIPDLETSPTHVLRVDGEELPYNEAMDRYVGGLQNVRKDATKTYYAAERSERREAMYATRQKQKAARIAEAEANGGIAPAAIPYEAIR